MFILLIFISCGNKKIILLPEINHSKISEINDISAAYLFYDETKQGGVELNRKNLISTTNWLVNVDKRLTLKQVIPHIKYLQNKKANSSHKNENAKNYYTCNDISKKTLGFIEFTNISYKNESLANYSGKTANHETSNNSTAIAFESDNGITIASTSLKNMFLETTKDSLSYYIKKCDTTDAIILLNFNEDLSFQNYIDYKSIIENTDLNYAKISNNEYIFN
jgi:hypothetical protein